MKKLPACARVMAHGTLHHQPGLLAVERFVNVADGPFRQPQSSQLSLRTLLKIIGGVFRQTRRHALSGEPTKRLINAGVKTQVSCFLALAAEIQPLLVEKFARAFEIRAELSLGEERFGIRHLWRGLRENVSYVLFDFSVPCRRAIGGAR